MKDKRAGVRQRAFLRCLWRASEMALPPGNNWFAGFSCEQFGVTSRVFNPDNVQPLVTPGLGSKF
jgi:hypothetical protein